MRLECTHADLTIETAGLGVMPTIGNHWAIASWFQLQLVLFPEPDALSTNCWLSVSPQ
ncbi:MAG: hypothetical protein HRT36_08820 [Alphaproteobacteria bacterium]|nr:hypothetical protein [Alphaproteobacteria bacterium]